MKVLTMDQYSPEWWEARCGLPSASRAECLITATGRPSSQAKKYLAELVSDSLGYKDEEEGFQNEHMTRGLELEEDARAWFEMEHNADVTEVGLVLNDDGTACCSPDGLLMEHEHEHVYVAGWECKCPMAKTHVEYVLGDVLPPKYKAQVHFSMVVTGLREWVFQSYHPELGAFETRVKWDDFTDKMEAILADFIEQLQAAKDKFK